MSGIGGVGGAGRPMDFDAEPIPEPVSTVTPSSTSIRRATDDFTKWTTQSVAIAMDGGPATVNGLFNRSVYGSVTVRNGEATFTRRVFNQPEEPSRKLSASEKQDLAKALEREIAAGGRHADDLRYVLSQLRTSGPATSPDLPGPILTEAIGEFGRAVAGMVSDRLKAENDDGLDRTIRAFIASAQGSPRGENYDFHSMLGGLRDQGMLDDLALELLVKDREFVATHPNVRYYGSHQALSDAVKRHCSPEMQKVWTDATKQAERSIGTGPNKDAKAAGLEAARELELGLANGDIELMMRAARRLTEGVNVVRTRPLQYEASQFVKTRLNTAIKRLVEDAKLNEVVEKLAGSRAGAMALANLHAVIEGVGSKQTQADWKAAGGRDVPTITTMAVGEEGRGPGIP
jgi:hypothetical protein